MRTPSPLPRCASPLLIHSCMCGSAWWLVAVDESTANIMSATMPSSGFDDTAALLDSDTSPDPALFKSTPPSLSHNSYSNPPSVPSLSHNPGSLTHATLPAAPAPKGGDAVTKPAAALVPDTPPSQDDADFGGFSNPSVGISKLAAGNASNGFNFNSGFSLQGKAYANNQNSSQADFGGLGSVGKQSESQASSVERRNPFAQAGATNILGARRKPAYKILGASGVGAS